MPSLTKGYLIGYNACCILGWSLVLREAFSVLQGALEAPSVDSFSDALSRTYKAPGLSSTLILVQCAALLEILHAMFGLVRSPVVVTGMQVMRCAFPSFSSDCKHRCMEPPLLLLPSSSCVDCCCCCCCCCRAASCRFDLSSALLPPSPSPPRSRSHSHSHSHLSLYSRIVALFALVFSPLAQVHFGSGLMIWGWGLVEVPRYAFYLAALVTGDATKKTPYPLFFLRYSLFYVLYPMGITGELFTFYNAIYDPAFDGAFPGIPGSGAVLRLFYTFTMIVYIPGGPFMYMNMVGNRKSAMKKRFMKPRPPPKGLVFPLDSKGERSTTEAGKNAIAAAVGAVDKEAAEKIRTARNWRFGYTKHFLKMVELQVKSPAAALKVAEAGLDHMYENFQFIQEDGSAISFKKAMAQKNKTKFETGFIKGEGSKSAPELKVPYKGKTLTGDALKAQVNYWVTYGTIESSAGDAIIKCINNPGWFDLSDKYFVMLGAG